MATAPVPTIGFECCSEATNRAFAAHIGAHLEPALPKYEIVTDLAAIPRELAGQHPDNPVNRVRGKGVQIEVPAALRWHYDHKQWSDTPGVGRAPQVDAFIDALCRAVDNWARAFARARSLTA